MIDIHVLRNILSCDGFVCHHFSFSILLIKRRIYLILCIYSYAARNQRLRTPECCCILQFCKQISSGPLKEKPLLRVVLQICKIMMLIHQSGTVIGNAVAPQPDRWWRFQLLICYLKVWLWNQVAIKQYTCSLSVCLCRNCVPTITFECPDGFWRYLAMLSIQSFHKTRYLVK